MPLWMAWWNAIGWLRPAFSRWRSFMWFATAVAGLTVRTELLGVTSIVRALALQPRLYNKLLDHFHSNAVKLDRLAALWTQLVLRLFPHALRVNGRLVRFVAIIHPTRGSLLLMCTDLSLSAIDILRLYGLRFKIEYTFKQAVRLIGSFAYHFWMQDMKPLRRRNGNQYLHRESLDYRNAVKRKIHAYHVFIQGGVVCQGLLQYLAVVFPTLVWNAFGSWLRTIRPGIPPSELVVAHALRHSLPEFLLNAVQRNSLAKFIVERQDPRTMQMFRLAA